MILKVLLFEKTRCFKRFFLLLLLSQIILSNCSTNNGTSLIPTIETNQIIKTEIPLTKTVIQKSPGNFTPTFSASIAPMATDILNVEERNQLLLEFLKTNGGCALPCLLNITVGETRYPAAKSIFEQNGWSIWEQTIHSGKRIESAIDYNGSSLRLSSLLIEKEGIVYAISLSISGNEYMRLINYHSLTNLIQIMGLPTDAWISLPPYLKELKFRETSFNLFLYYKDLDTILQFSGVALLKDSVYTICPAQPWILSEDVGHNYGEVTIYIGPTQELSPNELTKLLGIDQSYSFEDKFLVKNILNLDLEDFYQDLITENDEACYGIGENVWP